MKIDKIASVADMLLGAWLLVTVLLWHHAPRETAISSAVGALSVILGAIAYRGYASARWLVAALGVVLFVSAWLPETRVVTVIDSLLVGTLLFGFSALPTGRGRAVGDSPLRPPVG